MSVGGYFLPKGTVVFPNIWAVHNDPRYWENPNAFNPERFLNEEGTELLPKSDHLMPFSIGEQLVLITYALDLSWDEDSFSLFM